MTVLVGIRVERLNAVFVINVSENQQGQRDCYGLAYDESSVCWLYIKTAEEIKKAMKSSCESFVV